LHEQWRRNKYQEAIQRASGDAPRYVERKVGTDQPLRDRAPHLATIILDKDGRHIKLVKDIVREYHRLHDESKELERQNIREGLSPKDAPCPWRHEQVFTSKQVVQM
jgi:hypothetical protein